MRSCSWRAGICDLECGGERNAKPLWISASLMIQRAVAASLCRRTRNSDLPQYPLHNHSLQLIQLIVKEVSLAFDDTQFCRRVLCHQRNQDAQSIDIAVLIVLAVHEQNWFAAFLHKAEVILINGRADAD